MSLPGAPFLARQGAELQLDGCSLDALAREFGTPLYVYSQRAMLDARGLVPARAGAAGRTCCATR